MRNFFAIVFILVAFAQANAQSGLLPNFGGQRAGLSTLGFLKNDMSARSVGLSGASVALNGDAYSLYNNPAGAADLKSLHISTNNLLVGAGVNQNMISIIRPNKKSTSSFGFSLNTMTTGAMEVRTEFQPMGTGQQFYANATAAGLTYAIQLSDMFSLGTTAKYIFEQMADYRNHTVSVDIGFLYKTDFKDLNFAVMVQNFGGNSGLSGDFLEVDFNRNGQISLEKHTVPTVFSLGVSMIPYKTDNYSLLVALQLNHPNDNAENIRMGTEFQYRDLLYARLGYKLSVAGQNFPSLGLGVRHQIGAHPLRLDYSVNPTNFIGVQHIVGLAFSLNKMEER